MAAHLRIRRSRSMAVDRALTADGSGEHPTTVIDQSASEDAAIHSYDFRRPDRIAKDQLRAIHLLHENFARSLAASLSAFLRAYVAVNLVSVEQLSFSEFTQCLPAPTCMLALGMKPFDGNAVLEINPSLVFPIIEMLLGGTGKSAAAITREVTEIEQSILEPVIRIILNDLRTAWHTVATLEFSVESHETEPQLLQMLAPNEAVIAISMEARIGETAGMMNIGIPSILVKMLRQKFDVQWSARKAPASEDHSARVLRLIKPAVLEVDARLQGPKLSLGSLMNLRSGDVLALDYLSTAPVDVMVNGAVKYRAELIASGARQGLEIIGTPPEE
jgi:flagellar motor switch protein FliM